METYTKLPLTYVQQTNLLKSRGLVFLDERRAQRHLANISYYRLSACMLPYKESKNGVILDTFKSGTTWDDIYQLYVFDRKLRLLVFDAIERIEISIRTQLIYQLSHKYGSHWQDRQDIFNPPSQILLRNGNTITIDVYSEIQQHIKDQLHSNRAEVFIKHYVGKYSSPTNPPSWMSVEIMYFNHLSRICMGLKNRSDIAGISSYFSLPPKTFCSWLHSLNYVRNICAHHARLWNRDMNIVPEKLSFSKNLMWLSHPEKARLKKVYYVLCMINYLLQTINPTSNFKKRLFALMDEYKGVVNLSSMGIPADWKSEKMWKI